MKLSIVIPTYNRKDSLRVTLDGLARQTYPFSNFEVVVVSDGSTDGTDEMLAEYAATAPYCLRAITQSNSGPSVARNRGYREAQNDVIVFLDDDVEPIPEFLSHHAAHHAQDTQVVVLGPMSPDPNRAPEEPVWIAWEHAKLQQTYNLFRPVDGASKLPGPMNFFSGNASVRRQWLEAVGGFDETFKRQEDVELAYRLQRQCACHFVFDFEADGIHRPSRTFGAWVRIPSAYGHLDAQRVSTGDLPIASVEKNIQRRNFGTRALTGLCLRLPFLLPLVIKSSWLISTSLGKINKAGAAVSLLSACYNTCYTCAFRTGLRSKMKPQKSAAINAEKRKRHHPRIILDNGSYGMQNFGDVAMLQVAVKRLFELWPNAYISVVTDRPARLLRACPGVHPVPTYGHLFGSLHKPAAKLERLILDHIPLLGMLIIKVNTRIFPKTHLERRMLDFDELISDADLVAASGGGYMTDKFAFYAVPILDTLALATKADKVTVLFGQGLGPFADQSLYDRAKHTFSQADFVAIREAPSGMPLLQRMGIAESKFMVTGDDAVELAYSQRRNEIGDGIGVNLRYTDYAGVDANDVRIIREILHEASRRYSAPLVPLPISVSKNEGDDITIEKLLAGLDNNQYQPQRLQSTSDWMKRVSYCRVVITGSYHGAVFALSQGIPAICLAKSEYYQVKFLGLAAQFQAGCEVIILESNWAERLKTATNQAWCDAETVRPVLLEAAWKQIGESRKAYQHVYNLVREKTGQV